MLDNPLRYQLEFDLQRFSVVLESDSERIVDAVSDWIDRGMAEHHRSAIRNNRLPIRIQLLADYEAGEVPSPGALHHRATFESVEFYSGPGTTFLVIEGETSIDIDLNARIARGFVSSRHLEKPWTISHRIYYLPILEILKSCGAYYIHAGSICRDGCCVLLCGGSGHGKSTLTYTLVRAGFSYMSDDAVFLMDNGDEFEVFSFPEKIKLDDSSRSHFPEFWHVENSKQKVEIPILEAGITDITVEGKPYAVIFPVISNSTESELVPISKHDALLILIRQSITLTDQVNIEDHLDILRQLCNASRTYRLYFGSDFERLPSLVEETLFP